MASRNPALSDSIFERETTASRNGSFSPGWGGRPSDELPPGMFSGSQTATAYGTAQQHQSPQGYGGPAGPVDTDAGTMRLSGALTASAVLIAIVFVGALFGWRAVEVTEIGSTASGEVVRDIAFPSWMFFVMIGAVAVGFLTSFKPKLARITGPIYSAGMGAAAGAISHAYNAQWDGIVLQAITATAGVFVVMLALYATRTIRVTDRLRSTVIAATMGIALVYLVSLGLQIFGVRVPLLNDASPVGILVSVVVAGIAAFNLLLDFDRIERGVQMRAPKYMEWYGAFALMVSLIWLYLEILRLLAKLRER